MSGRANLPHHQLVKAALRVERAIDRGRVLGVPEVEVRAAIRAEQARVLPTPYPFDWDRVDDAVLARSRQMADGSSDDR